MCSGLRPSSWLSVVLGVLGAVSISVEGEVSQGVCSPLPAWPVQGQGTPGIPSLLGQIPLLAVTL